MSYVLDITPLLCQTSTQKTQNQSANEQQELTIRQHCGVCKHTCYVEKNENGKDTIQILRDDENHRGPWVCEASRW